MVRKNFHCIQSEITESFISTKKTNQDQHLEREVTRWFYLHVANLNVSISCPRRGRTNYEEAHFYLQL